MSTLEARDATTELGDVVARGVSFTCNIKDKAQCTTCPKPTKKQGKCLKGAKCKRDIDPRKTIHVIMDSIASGSWGPGDVLETAGLSVCSVMVVYSQDKFVMAHIPPARAAGTTLVSSMDVIEEYKTKMTAAFHAEHMTAVTTSAYLLVSSKMATEEQTAMRQWFADVHVPVTPHTYHRNDAYPGSGNLVFTRETEAWPPIISFG